MVVVSICSIMCVLVMSHLYLFPFISFSSVKCPAPNAVALCQCRTERSVQPCRCISRLAIL